MATHNRYVELHGAYSQREVRYDSLSLSSSLQPGDILSVRVEAKPQA